MTTTAFMVSIIGRDWGKSGMSADNSGNAAGANWPGRPPNIGRRRQRVLRATVLQRFALSSNMETHWKPSGQRSDTDGSILEICRPLKIVITGTVITGSDGPLSREGEKSCLFLSEAERVVSSGLSLKSATDEARRRRRLHWIDR
jgi:hypothetical protein